MRNRRRYLRKKMIEQKLYGIGLLILSALIVLFAMRAKMFEEQDITPIVFLVPLGLNMLFSKECWI